MVMTYPHGCWTDRRPDCACVFNVAPQFASLDPAGVFDLARSETSLLTRDIHAETARITHAARRWGWPVVPDNATISEGLADRLESWLEGPGSLLVDAPRGYGKTTQLLAWLTARDQHDLVIWIAGSSFLNTWESTWNTVLDALVDLGEISRETRAATTGMQQLFSVFQRLTRRVIVVYDDFDRFTPVRDFADVEESARHFPLLRNIFLTSTPLPESGREADPHRVTLTRADLRWTADFARTVLGPDVAGSRLAHRLDDVVDAAGGRASAILDYFRVARSGGFTDPLPTFQADWMSQRANTADPSGRAAMLMLHLAQFIEAPVDMLVDQGFPDAVELVRVLRAEGLTSDARSAFAFADAVSLALTDRDALATRSEAMIGSGLAGLHRRSALGFVRRGAHTLAAFHYAKAGEFTLAIELLKRPLQDYDGTGGIVAVREAFYAIPIDRVAEDLELLAIRVLATHLEPSNESREKGESEARLLSATPADLQMLPLNRRTLVAAATVNTLVMRGRPWDAVTRGRAAARDLDGLGWEELRGMGRTPGLLWTALAEAELMCANVQRASDLASVAREWNGEVGHSYAAMRACAVSAAAFAIEGNLGRAEESIREAMFVCEMQGWPESALPPTIAIARLSIAVARWDSTLAVRAQLDFQRLASHDRVWATAATIANSLALLCSGNSVEALASSRIALTDAESSNAPALVRHLAVIAHSDALAAVGRAGTVLSFLDGQAEAPDHAFCYGARRAGAALAMGDAHRAILATEECVEHSHTHLTGPLSSALIRRAVAKEILGLTHAADAVFAQAIAFIAANPRAAGFVNLNPEMLASLWQRLSVTNPHLVTATYAIAHTWLDLTSHSPRDSAPSPPLEALSQRELQVLAQLAVRATYREVGEVLYLSENTVKTHVSRIYRKLGASSRREALDSALRLGLVDVAGTAI